MRILFVCKANVGRSQMAEAFFNRLSKKHRSTSAGFLVGDRDGKPLHEKGTSSGEFVVGSTTELGYDLSENRRKQLTPRMVRDADGIFVMADREEVPDYLRGSKKAVFWDVADGKGQPYEFHCRMRDQIRSLVEGLIKEIG